MSCDDSRIELGWITGPWGVAGWVRIHSHTDPSENIFDYQPWHTDKPSAPLRFVQWRRLGARLVARLDRVDDRSAAEALKGTRLYTSRGRLPEPDPGTWYWRDLLGVEVVNLQNVRLGRVSGLIDAGAHDVLEVRQALDAPELLIPFVPDRFVKSVDLDAGLVRVDWDPDWE